MRRAGGPPQARRARPGRAGAGQWRLAPLVILLAAPAALAEAAALEATALEATGLEASCARPRNATEQVICRDPGLRQADTALAALAEALGQPPEQRQEWTRRRDRMCPGPAPAPCLALAYAERTAYLRVQRPGLAMARPASPAPPPPVPVPSARLSGSATPPSVAMASPAALPAPAGVQSSGAASCPAVSSTALRGLGWSGETAPFGRPLRQWTRQDFTTLIARAEQCQAENGDNPRNLQAMRRILDSLRAMAPEAALPALAPTLAQPMPEPPAVSLDCADPALLRDVALTYRTLPGQPSPVEQPRLYRPRPYADVILDAYNATPALQAEYQRLLPYMAPMPQCLVQASTRQGEATLSYRLYMEDGRALVEVRRMP